MKPINTGRGYKICLYLTVQDMIGVGEEWLVDKDENVRAVFIDGVMGCQIFDLPVGNTEITKVA